LTRIERSFTHSASPKMILAIILEAMLMCLDDGAATDLLQQ
jgi:hypothetical protein